MLDLIFPWHHLEILIFEQKSHVIFCTGSWKFCSLPCILASLLHQNEHIKYSMGPLIPSIFPSFSNFLSLSDSSISLTYQEPTYLQLEESWALAFFTSSPPKYPPWRWGKSSTSPHYLSWKWTMPPIHHNWCIFSMENQCICSLINIH